MPLTDETWAQVTNLALMQILGQGGVISPDNPLIVGSSAELVEALHEDAYLANIDILTTSYVATKVVTLKIYCAFDAAGILNVQRTRDGSTVVENLNGSVNLFADSAYAFDIPVSDGDTVNFQYTIGCNLLTVKVFETEGL